MVDNLFHFQLKPGNERLLENLSKFMFYVTECLPSSSSSNFSAEAFNFAKTYCCERVVTYLLFIRRSCYAVLVPNGLKLFLEGLRLPNLFKFSSLNTWMVKTCEDFFKETSLIRFFLQSNVVQTNQIVIINTYLKMWRYSKLILFHFL